MSAIALTIAGSDSSGGAGIQADIKTFSALGVYGTSVITAVTAQNTLGVTAIHDIPPAVIAAQIKAVLSDIAVNAIKIGMLSRPEAIDVIADALGQWPDLPVVLDPVMVATSGDALISQDAVAALVKELLGRSALITPNLHEAAILTGLPVATDESQMQKQGEVLLRAGAQAVLMKGGHGAGSQSIDLLIEARSVTRFTAPRIATQNTHGTGCTLSSAIAAELAKGLILDRAVQVAKDYVTAAIKAADRLTVGRGHGPTHHFHAYW